MSSLRQNLIYKEIILTLLTIKRSDRIQPKTFGAYRLSEKTVTTMDGNIKHPPCWAFGPKCCTFH